MEKITLSVIEWHIQDSQVIRSSQDGFTRDRSCLTNLIFYDELPHLVGEGKVVEIVYMKFRKAFNIIAYSTPLKKLADHELYSFAE